MSYIAETLRAHAKEVVRLHRKLAMQRLPGKVVERQGDKVRVELGLDPSSGEKVLSPWVRVQSAGAGEFKSFVLPAIGEQVYLESPSGVIGADSMATYGAFDDDHKRPEAGADEAVLGAVGDTALRLKARRAALSIKERKHFKIIIDGAPFAIKASALEPTSLDD